MNFQPQLAALAAARQKTVTRRATSTNPRSPWYLNPETGEGRVVVGKRFAICPGRGKSAIAHATVTAVDLVRLGDIDEADARREGCESLDHFVAVWSQMHGGWADEQLVWRIAFEIAEEVEPHAA